MLPSEKKSGNNFNEGLSEREIKRSINIQWNSSLFFQIGLIATLLFAFWVVEQDWKLSPKPIAKSEKRTVEERTDARQYSVEPEIIINSHAQHSEPLTRVQRISPVSSFTPIDNSLSVIETTVPSTQVDENIPMELPLVISGPDKTNKKESLFGVQQVPVFPGCESLQTNEERKECFQSKIQQFISHKFDIDKFSDKYSGQRKRVSVQFTVNKVGQITELKAVSPEKDLSEEAIRVISRLPQMTPGKNNDLPVEVVYTVPISLNITTY